MDIIEKECVKVPNAILVSGLTKTRADEDVFDFLKQFGSISRILDVSNTKKIVEYESGAAVEALETLPCQRPSDTNPSVIHHIESLASVYTTDVGSAATDTYLSGLKDIAKLSGRSFEDILRDELARISGSLSYEPPASLDKRPDLEPSLEKSVAHAVQPSPDTDAADMNPTFHQPSPRPQRDFVGRDFPSPIGDRSSTFQLPSDQLSTPEVHRVVVEHIVKGSEIGSHIKLKSFSGRCPQPQSNLEVDYDTWRKSVEFCINDPSISDSQAVRKIVDSLSPPAANIVKSLGPQASPKEYLNLLDSAYSTVEDGDELFARFLNNHQNPGEKASAYLQRLHTALSLVVKKGGIAAQDSDKQLLKQFCRGCWSSILINTLQLEQRVSSPPSFAELLLLLRTEEDKQANKASRMKQHLGIKSRAISTMQAALMSCTDEIDMPSEPEAHPFLVVTNNIQKQIADLQVQIAKLSAGSSGKPAGEKTGKTKQNYKTKNTQSEKQPQEPTVTADDRQQTQTRPRPWYCFNCGEDGHIASTCSKVSNPTLVQAKKAELREKQRAWETRNSSPTTNLN